MAVVVDSVKGDAPMVRSPELNVRVLELGDMTVIGLEGDLVAGTHSRFDDRLRAALDRPTSIIVLDCSLLRLLGREEVEVLVEASDEIIGRHGRFVVRQPNDRARDLLAEFGMLDHIEVES